MKIKTICSLLLVLATTAFAGIAPKLGKTADISVVHTLDGGRMTFGNLVTSSMVGDMLVGDIVAKFIRLKQNEFNDFCEFDIKGFGTIISQIEKIKQQYPMLYNMKLRDAVKLPWNGSIALN